MDSCPIGSTGRFVADNHRTNKEDMLCQAQLDLSLLVLLTSM